MAAVLVLSVSTGSGPTVTDGVAGIDLINADNAAYGLANRVANPITVGKNSFEKWIRLKLTATPANYVQNFKVWFPASVDPSTTLFFAGSVATYQQGVTTTSAIAVTDATGHPSSSPAVWDAGSYTTSDLNAYTKYLVLQLATAASADPGDWTQSIINYSFDEA